MISVRAPGASLRARFVGVGEPVLCIHGSWVDQHGWDPLVPRLASDFEVVTYDRRGHGGSERPGHGRIDDDVADAAALLEHHGRGPAHVLGNSFGGIVALRLAAARPDLVASVAVHEPPLLLLLERDPAHAEVFQTTYARMAELLARYDAGDPAGAAEGFVDAVALGAGTWRRLPAPVRASFLAHAATWREEVDEPEAFTLDAALLAAIPHRVLLTQGTASLPYFGAVLDALERAIPRAERHDVPGGHVPHLVAPTPYAALLVAFFRGESLPA